MTALSVKNLRVRFDTPRGSVQAVDSVSFELDEGRTLAIVGESGCGKSVTALSLTSLVPRPPAVIETGEVWLGERNLLRLSERELRRVRGKEISHVFQDPTTSLHPLMTLESQLAEVLTTHEGLSRGAARERVVAALAEVGLPEPGARLRSYPHELSGGQRQRVMIAMALLCRPKVLIADEPTTALDVTVQAQILELLRELQRRHGLAILLITHDLSLVAGFAHDVAVMYAGSVVESASVEELFTRPTHPYTLGLLGSIARLDAPLDEPLRSIPGAPPDLSRTLQGCAFAERCPWRVDACSSARPPLVPPPRTSGAGVVAVVRRRTACLEIERVLAGPPRRGGRA